MTPKFQWAVGFSRRLILPAQEGLKGFFYQLLGMGRDPACWDYDGGRLGPLD